MILKTEKDATVIPSSVVQRGPQGTYAYVIKPDKTVEMRPIKVGRTEANLALVESGLKAGEQVVVDGQYKLQPGSRVELTSPQGQPSQQKQNLSPREGNRNPNHRAIRRSCEHFRAIHPPAGRDLVADGWSDFIRAARLRTLTNFRSTNG